ncbi:hypothetical protein AKJ09_03713 [Labilithrix luteola]|uniref:Uncharacterized protein n=1 Tax=Labilithrix luteola TaxID=1391654 RepID=A0A0K1PV95_9BACT|nr:hypothetical protein [Labilithrix luteola]AKU97049.1 hypothetical protein AKJ09_03713 [Labilithrix luteola]
MTTGRQPNEREGILVTGAMGRIFTAKLAPDAVYFYFEGHIEEEWFESTMTFANDVLRSGAARLYGDGGKWKTYASGYRGAWTTWFTKNRAKLTHTYLVAGSPVIRMGIQVVNLFATNAIHALAKSDELYRIMKKDVPRMREVAAEWPAEIATHIRGTGALYRTIV